MRVFWFWFVLSIAGALSTSGNNSMKVPATMLLAETLKKSLPALYSAPLTPLTLNFGNVKEERESTDTLQSTAAHQAGTRNKASVAFVVRRPG